MPKTIRGQYCSPKAKKTRGCESCYTRDQLISLAKAYNSKYSSKISLNGTKQQLWHSIEEKMTECTNEWCWSKKLGISYDETNQPFRNPKTSTHKNWLLSTTDIRNVMKQYESIYSDFIFLGPVPIDFCSLASNEVCNLSLKGAISIGKRRIGVVFNTDPSTKKGKHWISMFIDISNRDKRYWSIEYFDSGGSAILQPQIKQLVKHIQTQVPDIIVRLNCGESVCTHKVRHQLSSTECGVYSMNFIEERLKGKSWEELVVDRIYSDDEMTDKRDMYFRPYDWA